jgi:hypothetical protein
VYIREMKRRLPENLPMGRNLKFRCSLRKIPKPIRLLAAWLLIAAGFPLFLIPLPGVVVATGTPCFVIVIFSPLATRSRSWVRCVFAS